MTGILKVQRTLCNHCYRLIYRFRAGLTWTHDSGGIECENFGQKGTASPYRISVKRKNGKWGYDIMNIIEQPFPPAMLNKSDRDWLKILEGREKEAHK